MKFLQCLWGTEKNKFKGSVHFKMKVSKRVQTIFQPYNIFFNVEV